MIGENKRNGVHRNLTGLLAAGMVLGFGADNLNNAYSQNPPINTNRPPIASSSFPITNNATNPSSAQPRIIGGNLVPIEEYRELEKNLRVAISDNRKLAHELATAKIIYHSASNSLFQTRIEAEETKEQLSNLNEVVRDLRKKIETYGDLDGEAQSQEIAILVAQERRSREGALIYQLTTSESFTVPDYPWGIAVFNDKKGTFDSIQEVTWASSVEGRFVDTDDELSAMAKGIAGVYHPTFSNPGDFEELCGRVGIDPGFASRIERGRGEQTEYDILARFVSDYSLVKKANSKNPVLISINPDDRAVLIGSYDTLKRIKGGLK